MNNVFLALSDEQLEMVVGGDSTTNSNNDNQSSTANAYSNQAAASFNTDVIAANSSVGSISQTATNVATAANFRNSFNTL
jgi:hypothetical protein